MGNSLPKPPPPASSSLEDELMARSFFASMTGPSTPKTTPEPAPALPSNDQLTLGNATVAPSMTAPSLPKSTSEPTPAIPSDDQLKFENNSSSSSLRAPSLRMPTSEPRGAGMPSKDHLTRPMNDGMPSDYLVYNRHLLKLFLNHGNPLPIDSSLVNVRFNIDEQPVIQAKDFGGAVEYITDLTTVAPHTPLQGDSTDQYELPRGQKKGQQPHKPKKICGSSKKMMKHGWLGGRKLLTQPEGKL